MKTLKALIVLYCLFMSGTTRATPVHIEMIFLSPKKITSLIRHLDQLSRLKLAAHTAQADTKCVPMGDGCFHPQLGYMEKKSENRPIQVEEKVNEVKTINSLETSLINCDKNNHFDIFCGQTKPDNRGPSGTEVWFDVSSSLKEVDYSKDQTTCDRRSFMAALLAACPGKVSFSIYNTSLKEIGDHSGACLAYGTNDAAKLVKWIKESRASRLLLVTDVDEMSPPMKELLEENGAKIMGDGVKAFTSSDLVEYAKEFSKHCN